jgi:hypothetical protein
MYLFSKVFFCLLGLSFSSLIRISKVYIVVGSEAFVLVWLAQLDARYTLTIGLWNIPVLLMTWNVLQAVLEKKVSMYEL